MTTSLRRLMEEVAYAVAYPPHKTVNSVTGASTGPSIPSMGSSAPLFFRCLFLCQLSALFLLELFELHRFDDSQLLISPHLIDDTGTNLGKKLFFFLGRGTAVSVDEPIQIGLSYRRWTRRYGGFIHRPLPRRRRCSGEELRSQQDFD